MGIAMADMKDTLPIPYFACINSGCCVGRPFSWTHTECKIGAVYIVRNFADFALSVPHALFQLHFENLCNLYKKDKFDGSLGLVGCSGQQNQEDKGNQWDEFHDTGTACSCRKENSLSKRINLFVICRRE